MKYYTYIYFDPSRNEPIYVGKGCGSRYKKHLTRKKRHPFLARLEHMRVREVEPEIILTEGLSENQAYAFEIFWIATFGRKDLGLGPLLNLTDGGGKNTGAVLSEEHKKRISDSNKGKPVSSEVKQKISNSVSDYLTENKRVWSSEVKAKISNSLKGHTFSEETKAKLKEAQLKRRERERLTKLAQEDIIKTLGKQAPA